MIFVSEIIIGIVYPKEEFWNKFLIKLKKKQERWNNEVLEKEVLVILDPYFIKNKNVIEGHILSHRCNSDKH
ncbi:MAG: hypothetical protein ACFE9V_20465 [Candidatus Hodarchaeota archaeon]